MQGDRLKLVFRVDSENKAKAEDIVDKDPISRLSVTEKDSRALDLKMEGTVLVLDGDDEICEQAKEELDDVSDEVKDEDKEEVLAALKKEEEKSMEGFGSIFG